MLQNLTAYIPSLFGYKNSDSSLSTETGYIQDGQVSVTSKGSVFSVCHDIQATLGSTQPLPFTQQSNHSMELYITLPQTRVVKITFTIML